MQEVFRGTLTETTTNIEDLQEMLLEYSETIESNTNLTNLEFEMLNDIVSGKLFFI